MINTELSVSAPGTCWMNISMRWMGHFTCHGAMVPGCLQTDICLAYLHFSFFEVFLPSHSTWNPVCVVKWKTEFPEIKVVAQEKGTSTANWHIQAISKVVSSNFAAVNTAPWFSPGSTSTNVSPRKKITKDMRVLPAHIFFILNHLFKFIRGLASSFVYASLSTEGQKKLI